MEQLFKLLDSLVSKDKLLHFFYGFWIMIVSLISYRFFYNLETAALSAFATTLLAATLKETYDLLHRSKHTPEWNDIVFTILPGLVIIILLTYDEGLYPMSSLIDTIIK